MNTKISKKNIRRKKSVSNGSLLNLRGCVLKLQNADCPNDLIRDSKPDQKLLVQFGSNHFDIIICFSAVFISTSSVLVSDLIQIQWSKSISGLAIG
jgi:hypothetical protein